MTIDAHTHYMPLELAEYMMQHQEETHSEVEKKDGVYWVRMSGFYFPVTEEFYDLKKRLADMDAERIDKGIISLSPLLFFYDSDVKTALEICRLCNDWAYKYVKQCPERLEAMAVVPMQNIPAAVKEMERAYTELGMRSVEIAPVINGEMLDNEKYFPFYEFCEKHGIMIYLHPAQTNRRPPYDKYHAMNTIGYVQETNWALTRMIFGGVFEKYPLLKVFASHGGGNFPYQFGRLCHAFGVRAEAKEHIKRPPYEYLENIYFDTITHWTPALQFLADSFGADHILMGTDYPYDMADPDPVRSVDELRITEAERDLIKSGNWDRLIHGKLS